MKRRGKNGLTKHRFKLKRIKKKTNIRSEPCNYRAIVTDLFISTKYRFLSSFSSQHFGCTNVTLETIYIYSLFRCFAVVLPLHFRNESLLAGFTDTSSSIVRQHKTFAAETVVLVFVCLSACPPPASLLL